MPPQWTHYELVWIDSKIDGSQSTYEQTEIL
jgi:hypothetical protein